MKVNIESISIKNIRNFIDEIILNFTDKSNNIIDVKFLNLPNGTGKTTILNLIKKVLLTDIFTPEEVLTYKPTIYETDQTGYMRLRLRINRGKNEYELYECRLELNYRYKKAEYSTIKVGDGGHHLGIDLPKEFTTLLRDDIVEYFVFDGEKADEFLDAEQNRAKIIFEKLLLLDRIKVLNEKIDYSLDEKQRQQEEAGLGRGKGDAFISREKNRLQGFEDQKNKLNSQIKNLKNQIKALDDEINLYDIQLEDAHKTDGAKFLRRQEILHQKDQYQKEINTSFDTIMNLIIDPLQYNQKVSNDLESLVNNMVKRKLPAGIAKEFFDELVDKPDAVCICGEMFNHKMRTYLDNRKDDFLGSDEIAVLNEIKFGIHNSKKYTNQIDEKFEKYREILQEINILDFELEKLSSEGVKSDVIDIKNIEDKKELAKRSKIKREDDLYRLTTKNQSDHKDYGLDWKNNLYKCQQELDKIQKTISQHLDMNKFYNKTIKLKKIVDEIVTSIFDAKKDDIIKSTNKKIQRIHDDVEISDITDHIKIRNKKGLAKGQSKATAYSFISTIFDISPFKLPFVLDSPVGALDGLNRTQLGKTLSQSLFSQIIILIIDTEVQDFVSAFDQVQNVDYTTIWRDKKSNMIEKKDGKDFFNKFDSKILAPEEDE